MEFQKPLCLLEICYNGGVKRVMKLIVCGGRNIDKICFVRAVRRSDKKQQPTRKDKPSLKQTAQNS